ncbi:hypothetical protein CCUS01_05057 [Colletotrichum cuscutae]|uniref:Uncharacterized protein n=1 Tax=Colletotrichum cuscutae TaxID=1209917 RepID=A0AAI9VCE2_9PEZI|nr:hypothetical protein CCUS01_05057 [Colletotrichum cuscutae]
MCLSVLGVSCVPPAHVGRHAPVNGPHCFVSTCFVQR